MRRSSTSNSRSNTAWSLSSSSSSSSPSASATTTARTGSALKRSASVRQQSRKPPSSTIWSDISFALTPPNASSARNTSDTRGFPASAGPLKKKTRSTVERRESHLLIPSSDSGDEVECIPTLTRSASVSRKPRYTKLASIPIVLDDPDDDDDDDFVQVSTASRRNSSQPGSSKWTTSTRVYLDDSDDGVEIVPSKRQAVSRTISPARTPAQTLGNMFLPSSPQLLRPNSPTIRRHNSQSSQPVMLVDSTQATQPMSHTASRPRYPIPSPPTENSSSIGGSTLVGSSYSRHELGRSFSNRSNSTASFKAADILPLAAAAEEGGDKVDAIPETPRMSQRELMMPSSPPNIPSLPPPAANTGQTKQQQQQQSSVRDHTISRLPADIQKYLRADLASDPISEFGTPSTSPSTSNRTAAPRFAGRNKLQAPSIESDNSAAQESGVQSDELPGITQWYHDGLSKCDDEDSQEFLQSENLLGVDAASHEREGMDMSESQQEYSHESESILIEDDDDADEDEDESVGGNASRDGGTEDGYSSPLEGFWDLRDASVGNTQDREMYVNQFAPSKLQVARRQRKKDKMSAIQASLNSSSEADASELGQFQPASSLAAGPSGRSQRGRGAARAARPAKRARGSAARSSRGGKRTKGRRSTAIRPMVSSRSRASSSRPPAATAAATPTASAHYNHYKNEPVLDMAVSMNWEGGGMSRFG
ncbi:hypothetical protein LPJ53_000076 [Coemansia erecta]|uniref:Uncharacterized protein n=1 Tax=Coemansia erecta TaxID=147472 RepID=A0A9W8CTK5_9FUNG|nr:hypothetical protein LPJ53_000076 [Coemansia erecta]